MQEGWLTAKRSEATVKYGPRHRVLCRQPPQVHHRGTPSRDRELGHHGQMIGSLPGQFGARGKTVI